MMRRTFHTLVVISALGAAAACADERYTQNEQQGMMEKIAAASPVLDAVRSYCDAEGKAPASLDQLGIQESTDLHYASNGNYWELYYEIYRGLLDMSPDVLSYHSNGDYSGMPEGQPLDGWWWCQGY
jgi:hypothetical protein